MQRQFDDTNLQMKIIINKRQKTVSYTTGCGHMFDAYHGLLSGFWRITHWNVRGYILIVIVILN